jgi:hypothetical protein
MASQLDPPGETFIRDPDGAASAAVSAGSGGEETRGTTTTTRTTTTSSEYLPTFKDQTGSYDSPTAATGGTFTSATTASYLPTFKDQVGSFCRTTTTATTTTDPTIIVPATEPPAVVAIAVESLSISTSTFGGGEDSSLVSMPRAPGFPPTPFPERFTAVAFLDGLRDTQQEIKQKLTSLAECHDLYRSRNNFIDGLNLIRSAQKEFLDANTELIQRQQRSSSRVDDYPRVVWAKLWAQTKNLPRTKHTEWAWILDECRKTSLGLLYKLCDIAMAQTTTTPGTTTTQTTTTAAPPTLATLLGRNHNTNYNLIIDTIAPPCLVMDRANCLYHMGHDGMNVTGLAWYRREAENKLAPYQKNPTGSLVNKRWGWLVDDETILVDATRSTLVPLLAVALPPRLQRLDP